MRLVNFLKQGLILLMLVTVVGCTSTATKESTGEFLDTSFITVKIKAKLIDDPVTSGFGIRVSTFKGVVQLGGFVDSVKEKRRAGKIAASVEGVKAVKNHIIVKPAR